MTSSPGPTAAPRLASPLPLRATALTVLGVVAAFAVVLGLTVVVLLQVPMRPERGLAVLTGALALASLAAIGVVHAALRRHGHGWRDLGFTRPTPRLLHLLWQLPVLLLVLVVVQVTFFLTFYGAPPPASSDTGLDEAFGDASPAVVVVLAFTVVVLTPIWEEAVFRGLLYGGLRRRTGVLVAAAGSALLFAAAHAVPPLIPYYLTLGVGFVVLYELHRTLWAPVLAHVLVNGIATTAVLAVGGG